MGVLVATALVVAALSTACGTTSSPGAAVPDAASSSPPSTPDAAANLPDASPPRGSDASTDAPVDAGGTSVTATLHFLTSYPYSLYASIGGGSPHPVQLDTGSNGLYVPASALGPSAQVSTTDTCSITYVSSGTTLSGHTATATVALLGSKTSGEVQPPPTTVAMSLCAVDDPTFKGGMMGVGYGRGSTSSPSRNVLLQMADVAAGRMRPGYALSTHPSPSVTIGVDPAATATFHTLALQPSPSGNGDWLSSSLRGCLALPSDPSFTQECGPLLVDTGVADTLLWGPSDPSLGGTIPQGQTTVPNGTRVQIAAPADASALDFGFVVGSGADSPSAVSVRSASAFSINSGRALLVDYDYLFDASAGVVGFRRAVP